MRMILIFMHVHSPEMGYPGRVEANRLLQQKLLKKLTRSRLLWIGK